MDLQGNLPCIQAASALPVLCNQRDVGVFDWRLLCHGAANSEVQLSRLAISVRALQCEFLHFLCIL